MKTFIFISLMAFSSFSVAESDILKDQFLVDYGNRCKEVLSQKGYQKNIIEQECSCEVSVLDKNFSTFKVLSMYAKRATGSMPLSKQEIKEIKLKLKKCESILTSKR